MASASARSAPPALGGLPVLGSLLEYRRDHVEVFRRGYRALGPVFSLRLGPQKAVVLIGPEHHRFFFAEADRALSLPEVYRFVVPMFGKVLNAAETGERLRQLAVLQHAFQGRRMHRYVEVMAAETRAWLHTLGGEGEFELWEAFEALAMNVAAGSLLGPAVRGRMDEFRPLVRDLANGMEFVLPPNLPLPRFRRRDRARQRLTEMIRPLIAERQARPGRYDDFLEALALARYLDGAPIPDEAVVGMTLLTLFTGYVSTAAQSAWALVQLLQHPRWLGEVLEEGERVLGGDEAPDVDALGRLPVLERALRETERMRPVMSHYARFTATAYEVDGWRVPRGWLTMVCPAVAHRLPHVFADPDVYDPGRFAPGRAEDRRHPHALIGFGGGVYRCPGARFGVNEMKVILSLLLGRYTLELAEPDPRPDYEIGIVRPYPPCRVRYRLRHRPRRQPAAVLHAGATSTGGCPFHHASGEEP